MHAPASTPPSSRADRLVDAIALVGPTASGKTAAALALAHSLQPQGGAEIISVDSALVYLSMDIGTAKPSRDELAAVPHHLIDTLDPLHSYSAADFAKDATRLIRNIRSRGKTPLLVGGTMLYLKALLVGLNDIPAADPQVRAQIHQQAEQLGWPALHAQLAQVDPQTAARLALGDSQRIGRALEVWMATGQTLTSFHQSTKATPPDWRIAGVFSQGGKPVALLNIDELPPRQQQLRVGDKLPGGAKILAITPDRLCILLGGKKRSLTIYRE